MSDITNVADVVFWVEQESSIQIKAVSPEGDLVELTTKEARELAQALIRAAESIEQS